MFCTKQNRFWVHLSAVSTHRSALSVINKPNAFLFL